MKSRLIKDTTKEERINIINEMYHCISDCDMCGICAVFKGKSPLDVYIDYIDGKKEINEISIYNL